jgi:DNA repair protein RadC
MNRGWILASPKAARDCLALRFGEVQHEIFAALYLTKRCQLIAYEDLFRGTLDGASVHPRIVVKEALRHNAAALILTHTLIRVAASSPHRPMNNITGRLEQQLELMDVYLIDHIFQGRRRHPLLCRARAHVAPV